MTGSEILLKSLTSNNITTIFGYPGGAIMPIYDALSKNQQLRHILVRHEQGAIHAAEGYARATNKIGVCFATSGPGATNLVTGLVDALMDSVPILAITGQVQSDLIGKEAFQETDVVGITSVLTRYNFLITDPCMIEDTMYEAIKIAKSQRPGPVLIDISKDAQTNEVTSRKNIYHIPIDMKKINEKLVRDACEIINNSKRPLILAGHGIRIASSYSELHKFSDNGNIPVACTLHGLSVINEGSPRYIGMLGMHGNYAPNMATAKSDCIIALGMRFDDRVTGRLDDYAKSAKIIHVDINKNEFDKNVKTHISIHTDLKDFFKLANNKLKYQKRSNWFKDLDKWSTQEKIKVLDREEKNNNLTCAYIIKRLSDITDGRAYVISDVGQNQMITARYYKSKIPNSFFTSGGAGTMGFALPAGIGVKIAKPQEEVWIVVGDGGIQMTLQELAVIKQENLNIKIAIINNSFLGMVRQWQDMFFDGQLSHVSLKNPDFITLAKGFGIKGETVNSKDNVDNAIKKARKYKGAYIIEFKTQKEEVIFPMIEPGASTEEIRLE